MESLQPVIVNLLMVITGALICSLSIFFANRHRNGGNNHKEQLARQLALYEETAVHVAEVQHVYRKYSSLVLESLRFKGNWPQARMDELNEVIEEFTLVYRDLDIAESKLLLLGEKNLAKILKIYASKVAQFRKSVVYGKQDLAEDEASELAKDISMAREKFFDVLHTQYSKDIA